MQVNVQRNVDVVIVVSPSSVSPSVVIVIGNQHSSFTTSRVRIIVMGIASSCQFPPYPHHNSSLHLIAAFITSSIAFIHFTSLHYYLLHHHRHHQRALIHYHRRTLSIHLPSSSSSCQQHHHHQHIMPSAPFVAH